MENRPQGREKNVKEGSAGISRRGAGLGTGKTGNHTQDFIKNRTNKENSHNSSDEKPRPQQVRRTSGGGGKKAGISGIAVIIIIIIIIFLCRSCFCGGKTLDDDYEPAAQTASIDNDFLDGYDYEDYYDNYNYSSFGWSTNSNSSTGSLHSSWNDNTGVLNKEVVKGTPAKRTKLLGNGKDTVTLMVYMCASDLESSGGAATMDIQEMINASSNSNLNILVYTGGTVQWQNNVIDSKTNQIYQVADGGLYRLEADMGKKPMTDPNTLTEFINYCTTNFPANRNMLVLWDHGGGSVSGYAYDENYKNAGYMSIAGIDQALKNAKTSFDIIGFDTCLLATVENALMLSDYADYLVASEEVEPGTGWYYTDWLSQLADNTSISSLDLGKTIIDSFIKSSDTSGYGTGFTLSMTDLAELSYTVPDKMDAFADEITSLLDAKSKNGSYTEVINARAATREYGETQRLDQIDLIDFADHLDLSSGDDLTAALKSAIKYNKISRNMSNSYGLSIFFPYNRVSYTSSAAEIYDEIGFSKAYAKCIKKAATITGNGQSIYGNSSNYGSFSDLFDGNNTYSDYEYSSDDLTDLFADIFFGRTMKADDPEIRYLAEHQFHPSYLVWTKNADGKPVISLPEEQWDLVNSITINAFYKDGDGFYDLGSDNSSYDFDENGDMLTTYENTWLSIDGQLVAYFFDNMLTNDDYYTIHGHVPVLYNGKRANLRLVFDSDKPEGYIAGVDYIYEENETDIAAKTWTNLKEGATVDFIADYYTNDGDYVDSYMIGEQWSFHNDAEIADLHVDGDLIAVHAFTDIYNNQFRAPLAPQN